MSTVAVTILADLIRQPESTLDAGGIIIHVTVEVNRKRSWHIGCSRNNSNATRTTRRRGTNTHLDKRLFGCRLKQISKRSEINWLDHHPHNIPSQIKAYKPSTHRLQSPPGCWCRRTVSPGHWGTPDELPREWTGNPRTDPVTWCSCSTAHRILRW